MNVPAKVIFAKRHAVYMVSVAQPLAHLARDRAELIFTRMNRVLLISKQNPVRTIGLGLDNSHWHVTYSGTRK